MVLSLKKKEVKAARRKFSPYSFYSRAWDRGTIRIPAALIRVIIPLSAVMVAG